MVKRYLNLDQYEKDAGKNFDGFNSTFNVNRLLLLLQLFNMVLKLQQDIISNDETSYETDDWDGAIANLRDWDGTGKPSQTQERRDLED